jgi:YD repeat-containing protein
MFLFITTFKAFPQTTIHYSYDAAGNRTERIIYLEKGGSKGSGNLKDLNNEVKEVIDDDTFKPHTLKIVNRSVPPLHLDMMTMAGKHQ